jgi:hypothetical protein
MRFQLGNLSLLLAFHLGVGHHFGFAGTPGSLVVKAAPVPPIVGLTFASVICIENWFEALYSWETV